MNENIIKYIRPKNTPVKVGSTYIGYGHPIVAQTMTNTKTEDIDATFKQITELYESGIELIRVSVPSEKALKALYEIKQKLIKKRINVNIIADIHFNAVLAEKCATFVEKVRINPGNYVDSPNKAHKSNIPDKTLIENKIKTLINICKQHGTAIRIGVNFGSLSWRIIEKYGYTPEAMVNSALEFIDVFEKLNFTNTIISLKASDVVTTIKANTLLIEQLNKREYKYPIHLGVTEAGLDTEGRIKSVLGIGILLLLGIGDTIRVSLSEHPLVEVIEAKKILNVFNNIINNRGTCKIIYVPEEALKNSTPLKIINKNNRSFRIYSFSFNKNFSFESNNSKNILGIYINKDDENTLTEFIILLGYLFFKLDFTEILILIDVPNTEKILEIIDYTLHFLNIDKKFNEYISCPTCSRSTIDVEQLTRKIKLATKKFNNLKIAIMGCIVNGPGEMHDADYGCLGSGNNKITIYKQGKPIAKNLEINEGINFLINLIEHENNKNL
ncbi:MAG: (E)-4-hydroxy-3-methylbut-2-enyl-diphosphate synthase [Bacteroidales bacterium]|nr:(E)-4-hydroxy-3-methylbut-2-enyl-diphosphate synthase [Bacteroidales bacterium]